jgi:hypothetical protein
MGILDDYSRALKMRETISDMVDRLNKDTNFGGMNWYTLNITVSGVSKTRFQGDELGVDYIELFDKAAKFDIYKSLAEGALCRLNNSIALMEKEIKALIGPLTTDDVISRIEVIKRRG